MINNTKKYKKRLNIMEKKLRYIAVCAVFLSAAVFFSITAKSPGNAGGVNLPKYSEIADENSEKTGISPGHALAQTPSEESGDDVTKYILKYDGKNVLLITVLPDGTQTKHKADKIDVRYLTEYDINQLSQGIEVQSEDELYKLIEDFSS